MLAGDAWIADGNYHETLDLRIEPRGHRRGARHALVALFRARAPARVSDAGRIARRMRLLGVGPIAAMSGDWPVESGASATSNPHANAR